MAFELPITAFRHAPWGGRELVLIAEDWSAATFKWAFSPKAGATPSFTLDNKPAGTQGISAIYDAQYVHPRTGAVVGATFLSPLISEETLESLPDPTPSSADIVLYHTLYGTPIGGLKTAICFGFLNIKQGAPS